MNKYLKAIKTHVCSICCDSDEKGRCELTTEEVCAIELYIDDIVEIIHSNKDENFDTIYALLKEKVCKNCKTRTKDGYCYLKESANCSLERYFYLIIEIVNKVDLGKI